MAISNSIFRIIFLSIISLSFISTLNAQGHGPLYGLQTPTLAKGGVDLNVAGMSLSTENETSYMLRYLFSWYYRRSAGQPDHAHNDRASGQCTKNAGQQ